MFGGSSGGGFSFGARPTQPNEEIPAFIDVEPDSVSSVTNVVPNVGQRTLPNNTIIEFTTTAASIEKTGNAIEHVLLGCSTQELYAKAWSLVPRDRRVQKLWGPPQSPATGSAMMRSSEELLKYLQESAKRVLVTNQEQVAPMELRFLVLNEILKSGGGNTSGTGGPNAAGVGARTSVPRGTHTHAARRHGTPSAMDVTWLVTSVSLEAVEHFVDSAPVGHIISTQCPQGLQAKLREMMNGPTPTDALQWRLLLKLLIAGGSVFDILRVAAKKDAPWSMLTFEENTMDSFLNDLCSATPMPPLMTLSDKDLPTLLGTLPISTLVDAFTILPSSQEMIIVSGDVVVSVAYPWSSVSKETNIPNLRGVRYIHYDDTAKALLLWSPATSIITTLNAATLQQIQPQEPNPEDHDRTVTRPPSFLTNRNQLWIRSRHRYPHALRLTEAPNAIPTWNIKPTALTQGLTVFVWVERSSIGQHTPLVQLTTSSHTVAIEIAALSNCSRLGISVHGTALTIDLANGSTIEHWIPLAITLRANGEGHIIAKDEGVIGHFNTVPIQADVVIEGIELAPLNGKDSKPTCTLGGVAVFSSVLSEEAIALFQEERDLDSLNTEGQNQSSALSCVMWCPMEEPHGPFLAECVTGLTMTLAGNNYARIRDHRYFTNVDIPDLETEPQRCRIPILNGTDGELVRSVAMLDHVALVVVGKHEITINRKTGEVLRISYINRSVRPTWIRQSENEILWIDSGKLFESNNGTWQVHADVSERRSSSVCTLAEAVDAVCSVVLRAAGNPHFPAAWLNRLAPDRAKLHTSDLVSILSSPLAMQRPSIQKLVAWLLRKVDMASVQISERKDLLEMVQQHVSRTPGVVSNQFAKVLTAITLSTMETMDVASIAKHLVSVQDVTSFVTKLTSTPEYVDKFEALVQHLTKDIQANGNVLGKLQCAALGCVADTNIAWHCAVLTIESALTFGSSSSQKLFLLPALCTIAALADRVSDDVEPVLRILATYHSHLWKQSGSSTLKGSTPTLTDITFEEDIAITPTSALVRVDLSDAAKVHISEGNVHTYSLKNKFQHMTSSSTEAVQCNSDGIVLIFAPTDTVRITATHKLSVDDGVLKNLKDATNTAILAVLKKLMMSENVVVPYGLACRTPLLRGGLVNPSELNTLDAKLSYAFKILNEDPTLTAELKGILPHLATGHGSRLRNVLALCVRFCDGDPKEIVGKLRGRVSSILDPSKRVPSRLLVEWLLYNIDVVATSDMPSAFTRTPSQAPNVAAHHHANQSTANTVTVGDIVDTLLNTEWPETPEDLGNELHRRKALAKRRLASLGVINRLMIESKDESQMIVALSCLLRTTLGTRHYLEDVWGCGAYYESRLRSSVHECIYLLCQYVPTDDGLRIHHFTSNPIRNSTPFAGLILVLCQAWDSQDIEALRSILPQLCRTISMDYLQNEIHGGFVRSESLIVQSDNNSSTTLLESARSDNLLTTSSIDDAWCNTINQGPYILNIQKRVDGYDVHLESRDNAQWILAPCKKVWSESSANTMIHYIEYTLAENFEREAFIGLVEVQTPLGKLPKKGFLYHNGGTVKVAEASFSQNYGFKYSGGATIGVGILLHTRQVFFTWNGVFLGCIGQTVPTGFRLFPCFGCVGGGMVVYVNTGEGKFAFDRRALHPHVTRPLTMFRMHTLTLHVLYYVVHRACALSPSDPTHVAPFLLEIAEIFKHSICNVKDMLPEVPDEQVDRAYLVGQAKEISRKFVQRALDILRLLGDVLESTPNLCPPLLQSCLSLLNTFEDFRIQSEALALLEKVQVTSPEPEVVKTVLALCTRLDAKRGEGLVTVSPEWDPTLTSKGEIKVSGDDSNASVAESLSMTACGISGTPLPKTGVTSFTIKIDKVEPGTYVGIASSDFQGWNDAEIRFQAPRLWAMHVLVNDAIMSHQNEAVVDIVRRRRMQDGTLEQSSGGFGGPQICAFRNNDTIKLTVDRDRGTLSIVVNKDSLGDVFRNIPPEATVHPYVRLVPGAKASLIAHQSNEFMSAKAVLANNAALVLRKWLKFDVVAQTVKADSLPTSLSVLGLAMEQGTLVHSQDDTTATMRCALTDYSFGNGRSVLIQETGEIKVVPQSELQHAPIIAPVFDEEACKNKNELLDIVSQYVQTQTLLIGGLGELYAERKDIELSEVKEWEIILISSSHFIETIALKYNMETGIAKCLTAPTISFSPISIRGNAIVQQRRRNNTVLCIQRRPHEGFGFSSDMQAVLCFSAQALSTLASFEFTIRIQCGKSNTLGGPFGPRGIHVGFIHEAVGNPVPESARSPLGPDLYLNERHVFGFPSTLRSVIGHSTFGVPRGEEELYKSGDYVTFTYSAVDRSLSFMVSRYHGPQQHPVSPSTPMPVSRSAYVIPEEYQRLFFFVHALPIISLTIIVLPAGGTKVPQRGCNNTADEQQQRRGFNSEEVGCDACGMRFEAAKIYFSNSNDDLCEGCYESELATNTNFYCKSAFTMLPTLQGFPKFQPGNFVFLKEQSIVWQTLHSQSFTAHVSNPIAIRDVASLVSFLIEDSDQFAFGLVPVEHIKDFMTSATVATNVRSVTEHEQYAYYSNFKRPALESMLDTAEKGVPLTWTELNETVAAGDSLGVGYDHEHHGAIFYRHGAKLKFGMKFKAPSSSGVFCVVVLAGTSSVVTTVGDALLGQVIEVDSKTGLVLVEEHRAKSFRRWCQPSSLKIALKSCREHSNSSQYLLLDGVHGGLPVSGSLPAPPPVHQLGFGFGGGGLMSMNSQTATMTVISTNEPVNVDPRRLFAWPGGHVIPYAGRATTVKSDSGMEYPIGSLCASLRILIFHMNSLQDLTRLVQAVLPICIDFPGCPVVPELSELDTRQSYTSEIHTLSSFWVSGTQEAKHFGSAAPKRIALVLRALVKHFLLRALSSPALAKSEDLLASCFTNVLHYATHLPDAICFASTIASSQRVLQQCCHNIAQTTNVTESLVNISLFIVKQAPLELVGKEDWFYSVFHFVIDRALTTTQFQSENFVLAFHVVLRMIRTKSFGWEFEKTSSHLFSLLNHVQSNHTLCSILFTELFTRHGKLPQEFQQLLEKNRVALRAMTIVEVVTAIEERKPIPAQQVRKAFALSDKCSLVHTSTATVTQKSDLSMTMVNGRLRSKKGVNSGCAYFEVTVSVHPLMNGTSIGWGTMSHFAKPPELGVGRDAESYGMDMTGNISCRNETNRIPIPPIFGADAWTIGCMLNLVTMEVTWIFNGNKVAEVPLMEYNGEEMFAYVHRSGPVIGDLSVTMTIGGPNVRGTPEGTQTLSDALQDGNDTPHTASASSQDIASLVLPVMPWDAYMQLSRLVDRVGPKLQNVTPALMEAFPLVAVGGPHESMVLVAETIADLANEVSELLPDIQVETLCDTALGRALKQIMKLFSKDKRSTIFKALCRKRVLQQQQNDSGRPTIAVDLVNAVSDFERTPQEALRASVMGQVLRALAPHPNSYYVSGAMFRVVGGVAQDGGGVYREVLSQIGEEIGRAKEHCNPNKIPGTNDVSRKQWLGMFANAQEGTMTPMIYDRHNAPKEAMTAYLNLGRLMGGVVLHDDVTIPADFPDYFWRYMVRDDVSPEDCKRDIGAEGDVDSETLQEYWTKISLPMEQIRLGLQSVVGPAVLMLTPFEDIRVALSGEPDIDAQYLISMLEYVNGFPNEMQRWLEKTIVGMTSEERCLFARFGTGLRRAPLPRKINIFYETKKVGLPEAHTCSTRVDFFRGTSSEQEFASQLRIAIHNCLEFGMV